VLKPLLALTVTLLAACAAKPEPYRMKLTVTPNTRPPALYVRDPAGRAVYSWAESPRTPRLMLAEGREDWAVPVRDGDRLFIEVEGSRASYVHNGRAVFESATPYDRSRRYTFVLTVYGPDGKPSVYSGALR